MKKIVCLIKKKRIKNVSIILMTLFVGLAEAQGIAKVEKVELNSSILNQKRPLLIYTPQSYDENTLVSYDVIYVFDSQNREIFDLVHSSINFINNRRCCIVVGITSPYYAETDYARNNDYLPEPMNTDRKDFYGGYCCNSNNMKKYVESEVIPYIDKNYRTTKHKTCIGHSLSASFALDFMLSNNLFDAYLAISPNFAYDEEQLATKIIHFNYKQLNSNKFIYITNANESWTGWKAAREKVYAFLEDKKNISENFHIKIKKYPTEDHWSGYFPALTDGLKDLFEYINSQPQSLSEEFYSVKIRIRVPNKDDRVFITGNQKTLGNWNPSHIEMKKVSDNVREIELKVQSPTQIQLTRGSWETKAIIDKVYEGENISIDPSTKSLFEFEITNWFDRL